MSYEIFLNLIPPAALIALLAYFVNFFGKVIADQYPFTDDRKWHIQIAGSVFVLNIVFGSVFGIYLANELPIGAGHWWGHLLTFIALSVVGTALFFNTSREGSRVYKYRKTVHEELDRKFDGLFSWYATMGQYIPPAIVPVIVSYFATLEYKSGNPYWITISFIVGFYIFFWSAFQYSLRKLNEIAPIDVHFIDKERESLRGIQVLKYNDDNIRVRAENRILILNKSEVHTIEMQIPEKLL